MGMKKHKQRPNEGEQVTGTSKNKHTHKQQPANWAGTNEWEQAQWAWTSDGSGCNANGRPANTRMATALGCKWMHTNEGAGMSLHEWWTSVSESGCTNGRDQHKQWAGTSRSSATQTGQPAMVRKGWWCCGLVWSGSWLKSLNLELDQRSSSGKFLDLKPNSSPVQQFSTKPLPYWAMV